MISACSLALFVLAGRVRRAAIATDTIDVLLVEDDPFQLQVVRQLCLKCGYTIAVAKTGEEAIELAEQSTGNNPPWDLVLCDVQLSDTGASGVDVLLRMRELWEDNISVVMVSYSDNIEFVQQGILEGADSYMLKPVAKQELATVRGFVDRRRRLRMQQTQTAGIDASSILAMESTVPARGSSTASVLLSAMQLVLSLTSPSPLPYLSLTSPSPPPHLSLTVGGRAVLLLSAMQLVVSHALFPSDIVPPAKAPRELVAPGLLQVRGKGEVREVREVREARER